MSGILATVAKYVADLGVDAGKIYLKKKYDEKKLKESLVSYIEGQKRYDDMCSLAAQFDFQGLVEYIRSDFMNQVIVRISSIRPEDRNRARQSIIDAAVDFSGANTRESRQRVGKIIAECLDIIKNFYKRKIDVRHYIIAGEMIDVINDNTVHAIEKAKNELIENINESKCSSYSLDSLLTQAQSGDMISVNERLKMMFAGVSSAHPLQPYYGYGWKDNDLFSRPLVPEATQKYPVKYKFTGPVRVGDRYVTDPSVDPLNYAYRHQLQLVMEVEEAKKYLGDTIDPVQYEAQKLVGGELYAKPPEFPPAFACSIKIKDQVYYDYVLLRTQEILDDGTYIVSNREQTNTHLRFEFRTIINNYAGDFGAISYIGTAGIDLFGAQISFKFMRAFYDAKIKDYDRIIKIAELMEDGNEINITFVAGSDNRAISTLKIPNNMND